MKRRKFEQRLEKLERALFEHVSPLSKADVSRMVVEGRAEGLADEEIIARVEAIDPAACARGFVRLAEYCGICHVYSPVRDPRARSGDPLKRLIIHTDAGTLCILKHPRDIRLPLDLPSIGTVSPLLLAALSRLVDDVEVWKDWWSEGGRGNLAMHYVNVAEEQVEFFEREEPAKARTLAERIAKRIEAIRVEKQEEIAA